MCIANSEMCDATPRGGESAKKRRLSDAEFELINQDQAPPVELPIPSPRRTPRHVRAPRNGTPSSLAAKVAAAAARAPECDSPYMEEDDMDSFGLHAMVASLPSSPTSPAQRGRVIAKRRDRPTSLREEEQALFSAACGQRHEHPRGPGPFLSLRIPSAATSPRHRARYALQEKIGAGQNGEVRRAIDNQSGCPVAIKTSFTHEESPHEVAAMRACAGHPHVVGLLDAYKEGHKSVLVTELAQGDLLSRIQERGPIDEKEARNHAAALVSAVSALHRAGYCHRDIKLENLLLSFEGDLLLADFGCAEPLDEPLNRGSVGSPAYMPPEVVRGEAVNGEAADVWSIGVVLYALVAGEFPFEMAMHDCARYERFLQGKNEWPPHFSDEFVQLLRAMLTHDAHTRLHMADVESHVWLSSAH